MTHFGKIKEQIAAASVEEFGNIATVKVTKTFADLYRTEDKHEQTD